MYTKTSVAAAAVALFASQASAGNAIIKNKCTSNAYAWTVGNSVSAMQTIAPGGTFSEPYQINPNGGGISIKIATEPDQTGPVTQYEYTLDSTLWYDISNINGYPFMESGLTLIPSNSACRSVNCAAGTEFCTEAYNVPDDNHATAACDTNTDLTLILCSGLADTVSSVAAPVSSVVADVVNVANKAVDSPAPSPEVESPSPSPEPSPEPTPTPAPSPAPAPVAIAQHNVVTTLVTQVVTVYAEATAEAKRDVLPKRAAHRHHFHRHNADSA